MVSSEDEEIDPETVKTLTNSDDFVERSAGAYFLTRSIKHAEKENKDDLQALNKLSHDDNWYVRKELAYNLSNLQDDALQMLEQWYEKEKTSEVRAEIATTLGTIGEKALPFLKNMSSNPSWDVRKEVAYALGNCGKEAIPILESMQHDKHDPVKTAVKSGLDNI